MFDTNKDATAPSMQDVLSGASPSVMPKLPVNETIPTPVVDYNSVQPQEAPKIPDAPTATPTLKKPSVWQNVLSGALIGLAGSGGAKNFAQGMAGGARAKIGYDQQQEENEMHREQLDMQKQEVQSRIKFQSAQAASLAADAALKDKQLHALPQKLQDEHNASALQQMKFMQDMGLTPTLVVGNAKGGQEAMAGMTQLTQSHGAVPPLFTIVMNDKIVGYDLNQLSQAPQALTQINQIRTITGQPALNPQQWAQTPQQVKNQQTADAFGFWNPDPSEKNYIMYNNYLKTVKAAPDSPEKAANVQKLEGIVTSMRSGLDEVNARDQRDAVNKAAAVADATARVRSKYKEDELDNKPPSGVQSSALRFLLRAKDASDNLDTVEQKIADKGLVGQGYLNFAPNFMQTETGQLYQQAARSFTEARLRKDSGAAIPETEFENDRKMYFAQPGDTKEVLEQKRKARMAVLEGIAAESGRAYDQYFGEKFKPGTFANIGGKEGGAQKGGEQQNGQQNSGGWGSKFGGVKKVNGN